MHSAGAWHDYVVTSRNSGTETVEALPKHAWLEMAGSACATRPLHWAVSEPSTQIRASSLPRQDAGIQLTEQHRGPTPTSGAVRFSEPVGRKGLGRRRKRLPRLRCFVEPVAGEGGIHPLPEAFLSGWERSRREGFIGVR